MWLIKDTFCFKVSFVLFGTWLKSGQINELFTHCVEEPQWTKAKVTLGYPFAVSQDECPSIIHPGYLRSTVQPPALCAGWGPSLRQGNRNKEGRQGSQRHFRNTPGRNSTLSFLYKDSEKCLMAFCWHQDCIFRAMYESVARLNWEKIWRPQIICEGNWV